MLNAVRATRGIVAAPHSLAAQAGLSILAEGGNAIEAALAASATAGVLLPHAMGLGGDSFWLVHEPGRPPVSIDSSGSAARAATPALFTTRGLNAVPEHGPLAACTVAGAVSGWQAALEISERWGGHLPLSRLLEAAVHYARAGAPISPFHAEAARALREKATADDAFQSVYMAGERVRRSLSVFNQPALAETLERLARAGLDDFYRGRLGRAIAAALTAAGSPLVSEDLSRHRSVRRRPLHLRAFGATLYAPPPPTQGLAALILPAVFERLGVGESGRFAHAHGLIESAKLAEGVRDTHITDPTHMAVHPTTYLTDHVLDGLAAEIGPKRVLPRTPDSTARSLDQEAWIGVIDLEGRAVSCLHGLGGGFGSGVFLAETGIVWNNQGAAFSLDRSARALLRPGRKPPHAFSPVLARFDDGRLMALGASGGLLQPQILAAFLSRHAAFGEGLAQAVSAPRWTLRARPSGSATPVARPVVTLEDRCPTGLGRDLEAVGHTVVVGPAFDPGSGRVGAVVRHADGLLEGASDPRDESQTAGR